MKRFVLISSLLLVSAASIIGDDYTVTSSADDGSPGTLRDIVLNQARNGDRILFDSSVSSIALTGGEIAISNAIEIVGHGVTIDAGLASRIFYIYAATSHDVVMEGLTLKNGKTLGTDVGIDRPGHGGAILSERCKSLTLQDCVILDSEADRGGGLRTAYAVNIYNSRFSGNHAYTTGGGMFFDVPGSRLIHIVGGEFSGNTVENVPGGGFVGGGAFHSAYWDKSWILIEGGTVFSNNVTGVERDGVTRAAKASEGGAVLLTGKAGGDYTIRDALFVDNHSLTSHGGAMRIVPGDATIDNCTFRDNVAYAGAGAIAVGGTSYIINSYFEGNTATNSAVHTYFGGALGLRASSPVTISNCVFKSNHDPKVGGGAIGSFSETPPFTVYSSLFEDNSGNSGGAVKTQKQAQFFDCTFVNNRSDNHGGAIQVEGTATNEVLVANCTFSGNQADRKAGAIHGARRYGVPVYYQPRIEVYNSTFVGNTSNSTGNNGGGAFLIERDASEPRYCSIYSSLFHNNSDGDGLRDLKGEY